MNPLDFLELALELKNSAREASIRTSVSRAYYAIFNYIKEDLKVRGVSVPKGPDAHRFVREYLLKTGNPEAISMSRILQDLRWERNIADYDMKVGKFTQGHAEVMCIKSQQTVEAFDRIKG